MNKSIHGRWVQRALALALTLCAAWAQANTSAPQARAPAASAPGGVVVVLAGGGAKGFAHLAVLRRLEQDGVPIQRIVGTSMGAVVGGLYASGMGVEEITRVIEATDVPYTVFDTIERTSLTAEARAYERNYPSALEFGVRDGGATLSLGLSDGQHFLALLQRLTAPWPTQMSFDDLKIPFRAVATRYSDGAQKVFDRGSLSLAIRASMAAPAVFSPVKVDDTLYVDGGLVANIPVQVALDEGAETLVVSYFDHDDSDLADTPSNAFAVANRMLDILIRQNEQRNLALMRPGDVGVPIRLNGYGFADFELAREIVAGGQVAVDAKDQAFAQLAQGFAGRPPLAPRGPGLAGDMSAQAGRVISRVLVEGNEVVPSAHVEQMLSPLVGQAFSPAEAERLIDLLYAEGDFERISYALLPDDQGRQLLKLTVTEKALGAKRLRTALGLSTEYGGVSRYGLGVGYRRRWVNDTGLSLQANLRLGSESGIGLSALQPLGDQWVLRAHGDYQRNTLPIYASPNDTNKIAYLNRYEGSLGLDLGYRWGRTTSVWLGVSASDIRAEVDTARSVLLDGQSEITHLRDMGFSFPGVRLGLVVDRLDSLLFPTRGHYLDLSWVRGSVDGETASRYRLSATAAHTLSRNHVLNLGADIAYDDITLSCGADDCSSLRTLELGGFQNMGAYRSGQLSGDRLVRLYGTYMYKLSQGGLWNQPSYVGLMWESGDAWSHATDSGRWRHSGTAFVAVDSKFGDLYFGLARGTGRATNVFFQLGQTFGD
jgi:NTE family protein